MPTRKQSGYYLMELAVLIPIVFSLMLGVADLMNILTAYSQMLTISNSSLEQATRVRGNAAVFSENQKVPKYDWIQYTYDPVSGQSEKRKVDTATETPAECLTGGTVSCVAEFSDSYEGDSPAVRDIDIDSMLDIIANDLQTRSILGELSPTCDLARDARCIDAVVSKPGTSGISDEEIRMQLTVNVPTLFLKYVYAPFLGRDFIQLSTTTTRAMETNFLQQSPLILNHGQGITGNIESF